MIGLSDLRKLVFDSFESFFAIVFGIPKAIAQIRDMVTNRATVIFRVRSLFEVLKFVSSAHTLH